VMLWAPRKEKSVPGLGHLPVEELLDTRKAGR
jgi:hypothetical protein